MWTQGRLQVSWGTKGSDKAEALPSISSSKSKDADAPVVVDTTKAQEDVDAAFKETVTRAITKVHVNDAIEKPTLDDQNKTFRTRLVAMWLLTNAALSIGIAQVPSKQNIYFSVILYSTFALSAVRFIGVCDLPVFGVCLLNNHWSACTTSSSGICSDAAVGTKLLLLFIRISAGTLFTYIYTHRFAFSWTEIWCSVASHMDESLYHIFSDTYGSC